MRAGPGEKMREGVAQRMEMEVRRGLDLRRRYEVHENDGADK